MQLNLLNSAKNYYPLKKSPHPAVIPNKTGNISFGKKYGFFDSCAGTAALLLGATAAVTISILLTMPKSYDLNQESKNIIENLAKNPSLVPWWTEKDDNDKYKAENFIKGYVASQMDNKAKELEDKGRPQRDTFAMSISIIDLLLNQKKIEPTPEDITKVLGQFKKNIEEIENAKGLDINQKVNMAALSTCIEYHVNNTKDDIQKRLIEKATYLAGLSSENVYVSPTDGSFIYSTQQGYKPNAIRNSSYGVKYSV